MPITPAQLDEIRPYRGRTGTARLRAISWYFAAFGALCGLIALGISVTLLFPELGMVVQPGGHPIAALCGASILSIGFFRTSRLLSLRKRDGAWLAGGCLVLNAAGYFIGTTGPITLAVAVVGIPLVASVWRHLE